jgi:steroid delta-isomerase-like uncharacterized protein
MSEQNKEIVRRVYTDIFDSNDLTAIDTLFAQEVIVHDPISGDSQGIDAYRQLASFFLSAFPQETTDLQILVAEGDFVAVLHTHHAVNSGSFLGMPPTGKTVHVSGLELYRIQNGAVVEFWRHDDDAGLMRQLGLLPDAQSQ